MPLEQRFAQLRLKMVHSLDLAWSQTGLTRSEKTAISRLVSDIAIVMLVENGDQADLKAIYNKHSGADFDAEMADEDDALKELSDFLFGSDEDNDDEDFDAPDERPSRSQKTSEKEEDGRPAREGAAFEENLQAEPQKSPTQLAAEKRAKAGQEQLRQSIREVYRKLVVALHPDLESDPQERQRKTELMQRVNAAYNQKNLLLLLELQLELEHIDQHDINNISEDRLKHYNKILREQVGELNSELAEIEDGFRSMWDLAPFGRLTPDTVMRQLTGAVAELRRNVREIENDLRIVGDIRVLKMWLKGSRRRR
ncbi:J domain-containing protein [Bradyrhizobium prioriisuperbiae]|uniref:J domain-containing protein n=1 Tax=Bradyrhizobium prioriisuperbiae TaxID=2854389 RepID=UPI0028ED7CA4|nr:J domain-containing protein [Bradyrhizobium prioritasuperba]